MVTKNFSKKIEAIHQGTFRCKNCQKIVPFGDITEFESIECGSCNERQLRPKKVGKFLLFEPLSQSKSGDCYIAYHEDVHHRLFSVKILPIGRKNQQDLIKKLEKEGDHLRNLGNHPKILSAIESGSDNGEHYLAQEFIEGERLDKRLNRLGGLSEIEALILTLQILSAETHIGNCGYIYRNLKPENIVLSDQSGAYLSGFELCTSLKSAAEEPLSPEHEFSFYMPPERILGKGENISTEIYSLGMVFYQCLTGKTYYTEDEIKRMEVKLKGELLSLNKGHSKMENITTDISEIIGKMTKRIPDQRYQSFHHVESDIVQALGNRY